MLVWRYQQCDITGLSKPFLALILTSTYATLTHMTQINVVGLSLDQQS